MKNELAIRKPTRLKGFDYSSAGAYFVTICTHNRKNIFSRIVGEGFPLPQLSHYGAIVDKWVNAISQNFNDTFVDNYVIMPNHVHMLISIIKHYTTVCGTKCGTKCKTFAKLTKKWLS